MIPVVSELPYEFIPPIESKFWCWFMRLRIRGYLRKTFAVHDIVCHDVDRLRQSIKSGHGVLLAPNHSRLADPLVMGVLSGEADSEIFAMASWHLFREGWYQKAMLQRMGAFSVYREGNDRASVNCAIDLLVAGKRPLVIFPEGAASRHCDVLLDLMDGPGFIARQASKRRIKDGKSPVIVHPVTIRYEFTGDPYVAIAPEVTAFEMSLSWQPQTQLSMPQRLRKLGHAVLANKEVEYLGMSQTGSSYDRVEKLAMGLLNQIEDKWNIKDRSAGVVSRVKNLRAAILPDMIAGKVTEEERQARWRDLGALHYAQQMAHYPRNYITDGPNIPERVVETWERIYEDYTDKSTYHGPLTAQVYVGEAIEVPAERDRKAESDPVIAEVGRRIQAKLDELSAQRPRV